MSDLFRATHSQLPEALDEARIIREQPAVRGQLVARVEGLFAIAEDQMSENPDPRWAEFALRCLDRLAGWYRVDERLPAGSDVAPVSDEAVRARVRLVVSAQLDDLASRA